MKAEKYRAKVHAGFEALEQLGFSIEERARVYGLVNGTPAQIRALRRRLANTKFQNMDVLDRSEWLVKIRRLALRHFTSEKEVQRWVRRKDKGLGNSPKTMLTEGRLFLVAAVLIRLQELNFEKANSKLVTFVAMSLRLFAPN